MSIKTYEYETYRVKSDGTKKLYIHKVRKNITDGDKGRKCIKINDEEKKEINELFIKCDNKTLFIIIIYLFIFSFILI